MQPYYEEPGITIYHGDCLEVLPTLATDSIELVLTDPPYGIQFDTNYTRFTGGVAASRGRHPAIYGDAEPFDPRPLIQRFSRVILFGANCFSHRLPPGSWMVWDKRSPGGSKNVMSDGEVAWYSRGHGVYIYSHTWDGFNRASERQTAYSPTQKPVALMQWLLSRWSSDQALILDPYSGAGSVLVAAKELGRQAIGIEICQRYCDIAIQRLRQQVLPLHPVTGAKECQGVLALTGDD